MKIYKNSLKRHILTIQSQGEYDECMFAMYVSMQFATYFWIKLSTYYLCKINNKIYNDLNIYLIVYNIIQI